MPNQVEIVVTARDAGATKVLDNVTASSRAAAKQAAETVKAEQLAADVMKQAGGVVSEASLRMVKAREEERKAAQEYAKVQAAVRKGYLDEVSGAQAAAAAMNRLAEAKMRVVAISAAPPPRLPSVGQSLATAREALEKKELGSQLGAHDFMRERMNEHLGEFGISESMGGVTAVLAAAGVAAGELANEMRKAVQESLEFGEAMSRASAKTGLTVETLSVLHYAAQTTGGDFEGMTSAVAKMDKTIGQATEGNKKAQAFMKELGLDARKLAEDPQGAEIAFKQLSATLAATENPIRRVELATALLGKAGAEQIIPTLIELGQHMDEFRAGAERTGNLLDTKTAEALASTQKRLKELGQEATGAGLAFTTGFLPAMDQLLNTVSGGTNGMEAFKSLGEDIGRVFEFAAGRLYDAASAAAALASVAAGGPFTETGKHLAEMAREFDVKGAKLEYAGVTGNQPQPTEGDLAYKAGLGAVPGGTTDPVLEAIRKRNAGRTEGFHGTGDITGNPDQKRLKAMEAALNEEKLQFGMSVRAEAEYWTARQDAFAKGSAEYDAILSKRATLSMQAAGKDAELIKRFKEQQLARERLQSPLKPGEDPLLSWKQQDARALESRTDTSNEIYAMQQRVAMQQAEMAVRQEAGRTITQEAAAMQIAAIHTAAYGTELERLEAKRKAIAENSLLSNGEADQQRKMDELTRRIAELEGGRAIEIQQDSYAVKNADQSAVKGATDALHEFRMEALDTARQMHDLTVAIMDGVHAQILNGITGRRTDFKGVGEQAARGVADMGLKKIESTAIDAAKPLLEKMGLGDIFDKKKDGSSRESALWVRNADGDLGGGVPKIPGTTDNMGQLSSLLTSVLPHSGGDADSGSTTDQLLSSVGKLTDGMFGGSKSGGDGKSPSSPLYVKNVGGDAGGGMDMGGLSSLFGGGDGGDSGDGSGGGGGFMSTVLGLAGSVFGLPGFADGVEDFSGGPALVGERGPEIVNLPRGSSVTPNDKAFGNSGGGGQTFHIDARGATDPAAVEASVHRAMGSWAPRVAAAGAKATMERSLRRPTMRR